MFGTRPTRNISIETSFSDIKFHVRPLIVRIAAVGCLTERVFRDGNMINTDHLDLLQRCQEGLASGCRIQRTDEA